MIAWRMASMLPPVDRSMTVSAPRWTAVCSFSSSSSTLPVTAELPMLALILHATATPMPIGSSRLVEMDRVGRDDHAAAGHLVADQLGVEVLALGDEAHLVGDDALAGRFDLGHGIASLKELRGECRPEGREDRRGEERETCRRVQRFAFPRRHYPDQVPRVWSQPAKRQRTPLAIPQAELYVSAEEVATPQTASDANHNFPKMRSAFDVIQRRPDVAHGKDTIDDGPQLGAVRWRGSSPRTSRGCRRRCPARGGSSSASASD